MISEVDLCLYCGYFMLEHGDSDITGWGERWAPEHRIEPFGDAEYTWGSTARQLWEDVWQEAWEGPGSERVYFDYLYFGI